MSYNYFVLILLVFPLNFVRAASESDDQGDSQEYSLEQDRKELEKLREEIPEDVRKKNDDLGFILRLFDDKTRDPGKIRAEFNRTFNRLRKNKNAEFQRERKKFKDAEKKKRKENIEQAKKKRKEFLAQDPSSDSKKAFFDQERTDRKVFFSEEKEKRNDFESDYRSRKKDFDEFLKTKRDLFNDRYRQFEKERRELKKQQKAEEKARSQGHLTGIKSPITDKNQSYLQEFEKIPNKRALELKPKEE